PAPRAVGDGSAQPRLGLAGLPGGLGMKIACSVNGVAREADGGWGGESLLYVLRERMGLYGSKTAGEQGECGSCSVFLDGPLGCACLVLGGQAHGRTIATVEGLAGASGLPPVQQA